jgi:hypothetical protein
MDFKWKYDRNCKTVILAGSGTQTAGLGFGGYNAAVTAFFTANTEEYDGSTWTVGGNLNTGRQCFSRIR